MSDKIVNGICQYCHRLNFHADNCPYDPGRERHVWITTVDGRETVTLQPNDSTSAEFVLANGGSMEVEVRRQMNGDELGRIVSEFDTRTRSMEFMDDGSGELVIVRIDGRLFIYNRRTCRGFEICGDFELSVRVHAI